MTEQTARRPPIAANSAEPREIALAFRPTMSELIHGNAAMNRGGSSNNAFGGFALGAVVLVLAIGAPLWAALLPGFMATILLSGYISAPLVWFVVSRRRDLLLAPMKLTLDDDGVSMETASTKVRHDWSVYRRARDLGSAILLEAGPGIAGLIPKRAITDRAAFDAILSRHGLLRESTAWDRVRPFVWLLVGGAAFIALMLAQGVIRLG